MHLAGWALTLTIVWLLLSGFFEPLLLILGSLSVLLVVLLVKKMDRIDGEVKSVPLSPKFLYFLLWLAGEVVKSSIDVARLVWKPALKLSPVVFRIQTNRQSKLGKVTYVNSITLTPGTVAVDIEDQTITVHALRQQTADDLQTGNMEKRIPETGD